MALFEPISVNGLFNFADEENKVLDYWRRIDAFQTSMRLSSGRPEFSFYDGPPFATGLPHYGHLLTGTIKDVVTRHAYATGHNVRRRFGWDTHGSPVEHEIDKKLGITSKQDVMKIGIAKYNAECRQIVMRYSAEWRETVERMGRWIDFDNGYKTLDISFMESVWWAFGELFKKNLVYRGVKVMPYSTGLMTPLSNFEADLDWQDIDDPTVIVAFPLVNEPETSMLAWTTTPYTLPANLALCVHPDFTYAKILDVIRNRNFIMLESLVPTIYKTAEAFKLLKRFSGRSMAGWRYTPLFPYYTRQFEGRAFYVITDSYVKADEGTGIVHNAPGFGLDDYRVSLQHQILRVDEIPPCPIDEAGKFTDEVPEYLGIYIKFASKDICKQLKSTGHAIAQSTIRHRVRFCWRSGTPLLDCAIPGWFVRVQPVIDELVKNNNSTKWVPESTGRGRFGNWLANAIDWNISRNRYWGTPIPLWVSEDMSEVVCVSSIQELESLSGISNLSDLHRENIDQITIPSKQGKESLRRIEEVFDCWFESGSMPYAQQHYPFENEDIFKQTFPGDFISEGIDQTRGWFYTLLVLSTHLFGSAPWKNVIVTGLVLAEDGKKMSKSKKNFPDPRLIIDKYGADAVRLYLVSSPCVRGENLRFSENGVRDIISRVLLPLLNSHRFFVGQTSLLLKREHIHFQFDEHSPKSLNVMDRWILSRCHSLINHIRTEMAAYRLYTVTPKLLEIVDELTNWYIRFNRKRLKGEFGIDDTVFALSTLFEALYTMCMAMSSFTPFITENIYQSMRLFLSQSSQSPLSIHFQAFPTAETTFVDSTVERQVQRMQTIINMTRYIREKNGISLKAPLRELMVFNANPQYLDDVKQLRSYLILELNVRDIVFTSDEVYAGIQYSAVADWPVLGKKLRKDLGRVKAALPYLSSDVVKEYSKTGNIIVDGIQLSAGDLSVKRWVNHQSETGSQYGVHSDNDVVVRLDIKSYPELVGEWIMREFINRVQKARKSALLQATDDVAIVYHVTEGDKTPFISSLSDNMDSIVRACGSKPTAWQGAVGGVVYEETHEIADTQFVLYLSKS